MPGAGKLLGWSHVGWVAGSRGTWAAGSGEEGGSGGDDGKFHEFNEFMLVEGWHELLARLRRD